MTRTHSTNVSGVAGGTIGGILDVVHNLGRYCIIRHNDNHFYVTNLTNSSDVPGEQRMDWASNGDGQETDTRNSGYPTAIRVWRDLVVVFNLHSTVYFQVTGGTEPIYQRANSLTCQCGAISRSAVAEVADNFIVFGSPINEPPSIYYIAGGRYYEVADRRVQQLLRNYTKAELQSVYIEAVKYDDHDGFIVHLPDRDLGYFSDLPLHRLLTSEQPERVFPWLQLSSGASPKSGAWRFSGRHFLYNDSLNNISVGHRAKNQFGLLSHATTAGHFGAMTTFEVRTPIVQFQNFSLHDFEIDRVVNTEASMEKMTLGLTTDGMNFTEITQFNYRTVMEPSDRVLVRTLGYSYNNIGFNLAWESTHHIAISNFRIRVEK